LKARLADQGLTGNAEKPAEAKPAPGKSDAAADWPALVRQAYLRTLNREPSESEVARSIAYINESEDKVAGLRGVLWALLNTKEFIVNH
jgi:hypothetical protein